MTPPRMNVTYFGLGVRRDDAVERDRVGDDRTIQAQQPGMVVTGVFRRKDHGRDVGKSPAVVLAVAPLRFAVAEVVQVEDDGNPPLPRPPHQLEAGRMTAVGQQHVGPEPVEDLVDQLEEDRRLARVGRPLGAAGHRGHERHPNAVDAEVDHLGRSAHSQLRLEPSGGKLQSGEHLVERRFPLGVENPRREHPSIDPPPGQQLEQLARTQGGAAGGVKVTMDRGEEQAHGIPRRKALMKRVYGVGSGRTNPLRSRSCHQKESSFRRRSQESDDSVIN